MIIIRTPNEPDRIELQDEFVVDPNVQAVLEFMQGNFRAALLVDIAAAVNALAPLIWERYQRGAVAGIRLRRLLMPGAAPLAPPAASGSGPDLQSSADARRPESPLRP
jgi:hypothetical protein